MKKTLATLMVTSIALTGCAPTGEDLGANVYDEGQLNTQQEVKTVKILAITPAKVRVKNTQNKQLAQTAGGILGGVLGAVVGYQYSGAGAGAGAVAGATGGVLASSVVKDTVIVPGVSLTYKQGSHIYSSTQAGRSCEFKKGTALMIISRAKETRIQPNAECPVQK